MVNLKTIEKEKKNIIKNFKPEEMESYLKTLITVLYESFLEHDLDKCSSAKKLIEEATEIYIAEGYSNSLAMELQFRLAIANSFLVETLDSKEKNEVELFKVIVANAYDNDIMKLIHDNNILKSLLSSYEKKPSEELASAIKDVLFIVESNLVRIKFLLEEKGIIKNNLYAEELEILKEEYSIFQDLVNKINTL